MCDHPARDRRAPARPGCRWQSHGPGIRESRATYPWSRSGTTQVSTEHRHTQQIGWELPRLPVGVHERSEHGRPERVPRTFRTLPNPCSWPAQVIRWISYLAPAEGLPPSTAQIVGFVHGIRILLFARVGVYRRFVNGTASATRAPCGQSP